MKKLLAVLFVIATASVSAMAGTITTVPEINPTSAIGALTLLGGSILVLRARLHK